uniref:Uncharacterized protein n=1 Tax=Parastrongyloides trichosuri TaxID=131310 RepID=A0A0N4Z0D4_PARTI
MSDKEYASDWGKSPNLSQYLQNNDYSHTEESYYATPIFPSNLYTSNKVTTTSEYLTNVNNGESKNSNNKKSNVEGSIFMNPKKNMENVSASTTTSTGLLLPYKKKDIKG